MVNICVFSGSSLRVNKDYLAISEAFGRLIGQRGHNLIYGGSRRGLMGVVASSVQDAGGRVIGIIPEIFKDAAEGEDELVVVSDLFERVRQMELRSDAFVSLPGGIGSLFESAAVLQSRQLNLHNKPFVLLNTSNFYDGLLEHLYNVVGEGFAPSDNLKIWHVTGSPELAMEYIEGYKPLRMSSKVGYIKES